MSDISKMLREGTMILKTSGIGLPIFEASIILCKVLSCDQIFLYSHSEYCLSDDERQVFFKLLHNRANRIPLQYIIGSQEFMKLTFKVTSDVLIPRHDTEILVEEVLNIISHSKTNPVVLDIGTGSGCIAISIAKYAPNCRVTAIDISEPALDLAKSNAKFLQVDDRVIFIKSNMFDSIKHIGPFDIIVSNPPYIPTQEIALLEPEVKDYEPRIALDGCTDGLKFYKKIVAECLTFLKPNGILALEIGYSQSADVTKLLNPHFSEIQIFKDIQGIERVIIGRKSSF